MVFSHVVVLVVLALWKYEVCFFLVVLLEDVHLFHLLEPVCDHYTGHVQHYLLVAVLAVVQSQMLVRCRLSGSFLDRVRIRHDGVYAAWYCPDCRN